MFEFLRRVVSKGGIASIEREFSKEPSNTDTQVTRHEYNEETETLYTAWYQQYENEEPKEIERSETLDEDVKKHLDDEVKRTLSYINEERFTYKSDVPLKTFFDEIVGQLNEIIKQYQRNSNLSERLYIKVQLKQIKSQLEKYIPSELEIPILEIEPNEDNRGNPNYKEKLSIKILREIVSYANKCIKENPDEYEPKKENAFISNALLDQLEIHFESNKDYSPKGSTIREHLIEKCEKNKQLFKIKSGY